MSHTVQLLAGLSVFAPLDDGENGIRHLAAGYHRCEIDKK